MNRVLTDLHNSAIRSGIAFAGFTTFRLGLGLLGALTLGVFLLLGSLSDATLYFSLALLPDLSLLFLVCMVTDSVFELKETFISNLKGSADLFSKLHWAKV